MEPEKKPKIAMLILVIVVIAGIGYLVLKYKGPKKEAVPDTLGAKISDQIQAPAEGVPDVNPYKANTNPFEKANPFKDVYKNPFSK